MIKSVICITTVVLLLIIDTMIVCLKPDFIYAINDEENYSVYYQKWIRTAIFMSTIIIAMFCIYFAVNLKHYISFSLLTLECLLVVIYSLVRYKGVTITGDTITVERLFRKNLVTKFSSIKLVQYIPNAKIVIKLKNNKMFDVSFNSENFHKLYNSLLAANVKFKTGHIPSDNNHVYLTKFEITVKFSKTMFREYYQGKKFFRNGQYLFSARSLENNEYLEGYQKESGRPMDEFIELIENDLKVNDFKIDKKTAENINGFDFKIIKCTSKDNKEESRIAYIYQKNNLYFVLYADCLTKNKESFEEKMHNVLQIPLFEDGKSSLSRI